MILKERLKIEKCWMWFSKRLSRPIIFLTGIVATLIFQTVFVSALPKPEFWVEVQPWPRAIEQCHLFYVIINARDPIERFNVKLPMPVVIDSYLIGISEETVIGDKYQHIVKVDEDSSESCTLEDVSKNNYLDLTAAAAGTTLSLQGANIPKDTFAYAWVAGRTNARPFGPPMPRSSDPSTAVGQFSYMKLGQLVTKEVPIAYGKPDDPYWWKR